MSEKKPRAIILTDQLLHTSDAKTAHGLIRGSEKFDIIAIIDKAHAGKDAGILLDGKFRNIPILKKVEDAINQFDQIQYCIIGIATIGGVLPESFIPIIKTCIQNHISIVNGLHSYLQNIPEIELLAKEMKVELIDVRKPKEKKDLHFWSGKIYEVSAPIIAVIGTDCALGKRTTCRLLQQACNRKGMHTEMIYTGQTGWMQGGKYGFIFDSTLNDFISGELEHAIITCWQETNPDLILLEGQSALRNPSGPCGAELLISGNAKHVILVHAPKRIYYEHTPTWGAIPDLQSEILLVEMYGSKVISIALNTEYCSDEEAFLLQKEYEEKYKLPILLPLQEGVDKLISFIHSILFVT